MKTHPYTQKHLGIHLRSSQEKHCKSLAPDCWLGVAGSSSTGSAIHNGLYYAPHVYYLRRCQSIGPDELRTCLVGWNRPIGVLARKSIIVRMLRDKFVSHALLVLIQVPLKRVLLTEGQC